MDEKQFKKLAHELVVDITSTIGTFSLELDVTDEALAKTQKLIEECAVMLAEFIDSRKPKFEVGDYLIEQNGNVISKIGEVINGEFWGSYYRKIDNYFGNLGGTIYKDEIERLATPEEITEYESALNFHNHGRKPFEVKKGDLVKLPSGSKEVVAYSETLCKSDFTKNGRKLLATAEEVEEWLNDGKTDIG